MDHYGGGGRPRRPEKDRRYNTDSSASIKSDDIEGWYEASVKGTVINEKEKWGSDVLDLPIAGLLSDNLEETHDIEDTKEGSSDNPKDPVNLIRGNVISSGMHSRSSRHPQSILNLKKDSALVLGVTMLQEAGRGIQISSLFSYLEFVGLPSSSMGVCVSLYSFGRMLAGVPFAYWSEVSGSSRDTFVFGGILAILASVIYASSWITAGITTAPIYIARFLLGACSGPISVTRSYLINHSVKNDKVRLVTLCGLSQYIGFTISPMISTVVSRFLGLLQRLGVVRNSGGDWIKGDRYFTDSIREKVILEAILSMMIFLLLNIYLLIKVFEILPKYDLSKVPGGIDDINIIPRADDSKADGSSYSFIPSESDAGSPPLAYADDPTRKPRLAFIIYFFANLVIRGSIGIAETLAPQTFEIFTKQRPIFLDNTNVYFLVLGIIGLPVYLLVDPFQRRVLTGPKLLCIGIICVALGLYLTADPLPVYTSSSWPKFLLGTTLIWSVGSPMCQTLSTSLLSDYLQRRKQTTYIGWITAAGSIGRILFPVIVGMNKTLAYYSSMVSALLCFFCIFGMCFLYGLSLKELN